MSDFKLWRNWLLAVSIIIIIFGLVIALLSWTPVFSVFNWLVNSTFWAGSSPERSIQAFQLWAYGMLGATMAGWGIFMSYIVRNPFSKKEKWAWDCIAAGVGAWFVVDTAISAYVAAYFNVAINVIVLILVALPLAMARGEFVKE